MTTITAELIDRMGNDLRVSNTARVSFSKWRRRLLLAGDPDLRGTGRPDDVLIEELADQGHFTPFTHVIVQMRETVPILVARQRFKHKIGFTENEESRRYISTTPAVWVPDVFRVKPAQRKQGSGGDHPRSAEWRDRYRAQVEAAVDLYEAMIADGVCAEQARAVLPQGMFTSYVVTGSLFAWARAYNLRSKPDAQLEIQGLAAQWGAIIRPLFPLSWAALVGEAA